MASRPSPCESEHPHDQIRDKISGLGFGLRLLFPMISNPRSALWDLGLLPTSDAQWFGGDRPPNCASLLAAYLPDETFCRAVQELFLEALLHGQVRTNRHPPPHFPLLSADL